MSRTVRIQNILIVIGVFILPLIVLRPLQNFPYIDDWTYAWSVENFLNTGSLKILDWSNNIDIAHVLWGALFCFPMGFSFEALRLSTWTLSVIGLVGFYLLLLELGVSKRDSLIGASILGLSPLYFLLTFTFMTDIPAITFNTWAVFCFIKSVNSGRLRWLLAACAFSILTIGTRIPGVAVPMAFAAFLLFHPGPRSKRIAGALVGVIVPVLCGIGFIYWYYHHVEYRTDLQWIQGSVPDRRSGLWYGFKYFPQWLLVTLVYSIPAYGTLLAPLSISCAKWQHSRKILFAAAVILGLVAIGLVTGVASPTYQGANRFLADMGGSYLDVPGAIKEAMPVGWNLLAGAAGAALFCFAIGPALSIKASNGVTILRWLLLTQFMLVVVLALWFSRYLMPLLPTLLALILASTPIHRPLRAMALIGLSAIIAVGVVHDDLEYNRALWQSADYLKHANVPWPRVQGGYMVNGWVQYAHPENAKVNKKGDLEVEMINVKTQDFDYEISNRAEPGWHEMTEFPYRAWFGGSAKLYVLKRIPKN